MAVDSHDLAVDIEGDRDVAVVTVSGELDLTSAPRLISVVHEQVNRSVQRVDVDCSGVDFLDSAGIRSLIVARNQANGAGIAFGVVNPSRSVRRVLDMTGLSTLLALQPLH